MRALISVMTMIILAATSGSSQADGHPPLPPLPAIAPPSRLPGELAAVAARKRLRARDYGAGIARMEDAWRTGWRRPDDAYDAACGANRLGRSGDALTWLQRAVGGFADARMTEADNHLASLRGSPPFRAILRKMQATKASPLVELARADQSERAQSLMLPVDRVRADAMLAHDSERRRRADGLLASTKSPTGEELFAAALIFQHGEALDDFRRARSYAFTAARLGIPGARWLTAAAWDRWLVAAGYPQRFGTQTTCNPECVLAPLDSSITDAEREAWDVPAAKTKTSANPD